MPVDPRTEDKALRPPLSTPEPEDWRLELSRGILDAKHRLQLGPAWHLYFTLLDRRRPLKGGVWVGGPGCLTYIGLLAFGEQTDERTIQRWLARLVRWKYIHVETVNTGKPGTSGLRIRILKARYWREGRVQRLADPGVTKVSPGGVTKVSPRSPVQARGATTSRTPSPRR